MSYKKPVLRTSRLLTKTRGNLGTGANDENITDYAKANSLIVVASVDEQTGPWNAAYYLYWRNVTDGGSFAPLASTGQCKWATDTDLVQGAAVTTTTRACGTFASHTWQDGEEVEGSNLSDAINLADEYYTEIHFAVSLADGHDGDQYEFDLYENNGNTQVGALLAKVTLYQVQNLAQTVTENLNFQEKPDAPGQVGDVKPQAIIEGLGFAEAPTDPAQIGDLYDDGIEEGLGFEEVITAQVEVVAVQPVVTETLNFKEKGPYPVFPDQAYVDCFPEIFVGSSPADYDLYSGLLTKVANSFTGDGRKLTRAKFFIGRVNNPTGNVYAVLYAHTGTFGVDGKPTGAALVTSDPVDVTTIPLDANRGLVDFKFSNPYTLSNGTKYCLAVEFSGGNSTNKIYVYADEDLYGSCFAGNVATYFGGSWIPASNHDLIFYAITDPLPIVAEAVNFEEAVTPQVGEASVDRNVSVQEGLNFAEAPTPQVIGDIQPSAIQEGLAFAENVVASAVYPGEVVIGQIGDVKSQNIADSLNFEESLTPQVESINKVDVSVQEGLGFAEQPQYPVKIGDVKTPSIQEALNFSEQPQYPAKLGDVQSAPIQEGLNFAEVVTPFVEVIGQIGTTITENLQFSEQPTQPVKVGDVKPAIIQETLDFQEQPTYPVKIGDLIRTLSENLNFQEQPQYPVTVGDLLRIVFENLNFNEDTVRSITDLFRSISEGLNFEEVVTPVVGVITYLNVLISEGLNFEEAPVSKIGDIARTIAETLNLNEDVTPRVAVVLASLADALNLEESVTPKVGDLLSSIAEALNFQENLIPNIIGAGAPVNQIVTEGVVFGEVVTGQLNALAVSVAETISFAESLVRQVGDVKCSLSEGVNFQEATPLIDFVQSLMGLVSETINFAESITPQMGTIGALAIEQILFQEAIAELLGQLKTSVEETLVVTEQVDPRIGGLLRSLLEGLGFAESLTPDVYVPSILSYRAEFTGRHPRVEFTGSHPTVTFSGRVPLMEFEET